MDYLQKFTREVEGILLVPYPASLAGLVGLLNSTPANIISDWVYMKPCQVRPLVTNLVRRFAVDQLVPGVAIRLLAEPTICECVCQFYPETIDNLYSSAVSRLISASTNTSTDFMKHLCQYTPLCRADISIYITPPLSYTSFIEIMISYREGESPTTWLRRLHCLIQVAPLCLIANIGQDVLYSCVNQWLRTLRSRDHVDCLMSMHIAMQIYQQNGISERQGSPESTFENVGEPLKKWIERSATLFEAQEGELVIRHTVGAVIQICTVGDKEEVVSKLELIHMARQILEALPKKSLITWVAKEGNIVGKLAQKVERLSVSDQLHHATAAFLLTLDPETRSEGLNTNLQPLSELLMGDVRQSRSNVEVLKFETLKGLMANLRLHGPELVSDNSIDMFEMFIQFMVDQCQPHCNLSANAMLKLRLATQLAERLHNQLEKIDALYSSRLSAVLTKVHLPDWWSASLPYNKDIENCASFDVCLHAFERGQQLLTMKISLLIFRAVASSTSMLASRSFDALEQKIMNVKFTTEIPRCTYSDSKLCSHSSLSANEPEDSPIDWRSRLVSEVKSVNDQVMELAERYVQKVCKDLQDRCDEVEVPLREQNEKFVKLQLEFDQARMEMLDLKNENTALKRTLEMSEAERVSQIQRVEDLQIAYDKSCAQYNVLQSDIMLLTEQVVIMKDDYRQEVNDIRANADVQSNSSRLEHSRIIADMQSQLSATADTVRSLQTENDVLRQEMVKNSTNLNEKHQMELSSRIAAHDSAMELQKNMTQRLEKALSDADLTIDQLTQLSGIDKIKMKELEADLDRQREKIGDLMQRIDSTDKTNLEINRDLLIKREELEQLYNTRSEDQKQFKIQTKRVSDLEKLLACSQQQCKAYERTIHKAKKTEESMLAILRQTSESTPIPQRHQNVTASVTPTPRLPVASFSTDDEEDFVELMDLEEGRG